MRGIRITAATIKGARNLLEKRETAMQMETHPTVVAPAAARPGRTRRDRPPQPAVDTEALIKQGIGTLNEQAAAEAERLREPMRKAVAMLTAAIG